ncbi:MAG: type 2 lanthipeptide synthetase LanM family protein [Thermoanaerobaculia bacterium]
MQDPPWGQSSWWRALTLLERFGPDERSLDGFSFASAKPTSTERRLAEWRAQSPFRGEEWFRRRLELDGLDLRLFQALLGEPETSLRRRRPERLPWLTRLEEVFGRCLCDSPRSRLPVIGPLVTQAGDRLLRDTRAVASRGLPLDPDRVVDQILATVIVRLDRMLNRAVVLEMKVASWQGRLAGESAAARFQEFVDRLRGPDAMLSFLREYPVLARLLVEAVDAWTASAGEFLRRLGNDWDAILSVFWPEGSPGRLEDPGLGVGDLHRGGREVCVLRFERGDRLVYKPRSLGIDKHFAQLLSWLERRGAPDLRVPRVLDQGSYGWCEFVAHAPCRDQEAAARFYERQGALLAVLYVLNANDFHRENLVAAGEYPVPVDLETLCGPDFGQAREEFYDSQAEFELQNSVVNVLLLPYLQEGKHGGVDVSGLGGGGGQVETHPRPEWEAVGTDEIRLAWRAHEIPPALNRPAIQEQFLNAFDFSVQIEAGFQSMYRLLERHRSELLEPGGPLSELQDDEARVVFRASKLYNLILGQSYHPDYLTDALDRERLFDRLWFGIDRTAFSQIALRLLPSERCDLWRGEIPYFTSKTGSRDLWTSQGEHLPEFFFHSGLEVTQAKLDQLGEEDLRRQLWYIRASLTTLAMNREGLFSAYSPSSRLRPASRDRLLAQVTAIAERLGVLARWKEDRASWVGLAHGAGDGWHLRPLQTDLYSGLPGIILFLAYAEAILGNSDLRTLAEGAVRTLRKQLVRPRAGLELLGGFDGWGGLLYVWVHLARLWQREDLLAEAQDMLPKLEALAESDEQLDVFRGSAGAVPSLLSLHRMTGSERALGLARRLGDRLVRRARPFNGGGGWIGEQFPVHPLTGFSHGASGIAWALAELSAATGEASYAEPALAAVSFERSHFLPEAGNWEDLRRGKAKPPETPRCMAAWCHGACGIGLSRLRMYRLLGNETLMMDLHIALQTTVREGFGKNHSLCHGDLGSLELILEAARLLPDDRLNAQVDEYAARVLASIEEHGWRCGVPLEVETPGLMDGIAGIGYGLLRVAEPHRVPSVLLLEGPRVSTGPAA